MNEQIQIWQGLSGSKYKFQVYPIAVKFSPNQDGNYIFARQSLSGWEAVYIGQGDIKARTENHVSDLCVVNKGATHIHAHPNGLETDRRKEEIDLLFRHTEAYEPQGCNVKASG